MVEPWANALQTSQLTEAKSSWKESTEHFVHHTPGLSSLLNVPGAQGAHSQGLAESETVPAGQGRHPLAPLAFAKVPEGQPRQSSFPLSGL